MTQAAGTEIASRQRSVRSGALRLNVVEWGEPTAEPIVLLHGLRADARTWAKTASALCGRYRLIGMDQRGRGQSDWDPARAYFTPSYVADLKAVVDALDLRSFILLGHSMGGATSLAFTFAFPALVRALIVEDIGPGSSAASPGADRIKSELSATPTSFASRDAARAFWRSSRPTATPDSIEDRLVNSMIEEPDGTMRWRFDLEGIAAARWDPDPGKITDLWPAVRALTCPTLVMRGERSDFLSLATMQAMKDANRNIVAREIAGASHYVHDDNFPDFIAAVTSFLATVTSSGSVTS